jgi:alanine racemase
LYGYLPDEAKSLLAKNPLKKSMKIYAQVIKSRVYHGGGAGYGEKHALQIGDKYTLVRLGYADGALRTKNNGFLGENVNNLCMDAGLKKGNQKRGKWLCVMSDADEVARQTGTISYEVLCAATRRAEFVYEYK